MLVAAHPSHPAAAAVAAADNNIAAAAAAAAAGGVFEVSDGVIPIDICPPVRLGEGQADVARVVSSLDRPLAPPSPLYPLPLPLPLPADIKRVLFSENLQ